MAAGCGDLLTRRGRHRAASSSWVLEGSGTFVADDAGSLQLPDTSVPADVLWTDFLPYRSPRWFAVVDARGRVAWTHKGDGETSLLVRASRSTPLPYLAHLRQEQIPYLLAGAHQGSDVRAGEDPAATRRRVPRIGGRRRAQRRLPVATWSMNSTSSRSLH